MREAYLYYLPNLLFLSVRLKRSSRSESKKLSSVDE